jgi:ABC-type polysaccharide/polyol phosphate export permease
MFDDTHDATKGVSWLTSGDIGYFNLAKIRFLVNVNPFTFNIEQVRDVLVWGKLPNWGALAAYLW